MDFDSSAKFISSLAKFLQSLCNGYVEFDNGVEVIGHIYLSVDTGKKIDYILNEKVCKTDENSVTFISNSFHAQPAEKVKPPEKPKQTAPPEVVADDDKIIIMDDSDKSYEQQFVDNVPHNSTVHPKSRSHSHGASKRSHSQSFASSNRSSSKSSKYDSSSLSNPNGAHNSPHEISYNMNSSVPQDSNLPNLSQVFPENIKDSSNSEERDIKPILDKDLNVIDVKQEYDPATDVQGDGNTYDEHGGDDSYYSQDQQYESGNEQYYGGDHTNSSQRSEYDSKMYLGDPGTSGSAGDTQGFSWQPESWTVSGMRLKCPVQGCGVATCQMRRHWREKHVEIVESLHCSLCSYITKRKSNLLLHIRTKHKLTPPEGGIGKTMYTTNQQFIDPSPFTLELVLHGQVGKMS